MSELPPRACAVLDFWFGDLADEFDIGARSKLWWKRNDAFDAEIRAKFGEDLARARAGDYDDWCKAPYGALAVVILLDQFSRNIHRDDPRAYDNDAKARDVVRAAMAAGHAKALKLVELQFLYMPLIHAEDRATLREALALVREGLARCPEARRGSFEGWLSSAERHAEIIERFGRYPHRNAVLGRPCTPEEEAFLKEPGSGF